MKTYLYNKKTKEIHRLQRLHPLCHIEPSNTDVYGRCGRLKAWLLMTFRGYDGCGHCWQGKNRTC